MTVHARPDGYVLPKVESTEQIEWLCWRLTEAEQAHGWAIGSMRVLANIETAKGVLNLRDIVECDQRLDALLFGAEDLAANIGATRTREGAEVFYARSAVVLHAAAFGLQALDMVFFDFKDEEGLRREALDAARMGYVGKQIIHPSQIAPVHESFMPSEKEIAQARRVVEAYADYEARGTGSFALDGRLVDMPVVRLARQVLERAKLAEKR
jgi:citrate lyase beta subunit